HVTGAVIKAPPTPTTAGGGPERIRQGEYVSAEPTEAPLAGPRRIRVGGYITAMLLSTWATCSAAPNQKHELKSVVIEGVPHVKQKPDFCGEAAAESWTRKLGLHVDQDELFARSGMDPARGMGATTRELRQALIATGFYVGDVWQSIDARRERADL